MIKVKSSGQKEVDAAKYFLEAILQLRDRFNESKSISIEAQGEDICVATCVLELLKNQFPNNKNSIKTSGSIKDIQDCEESGLTISFQVLDFGNDIYNPIIYVEKYLQQLIEYEKLQKKNNKEKRESKQNKQQQQQQQSQQQQQQSQQQDFQIEQIKQVDSQQNKQDEVQNKWSKTKKRIPKNYVGNDEELMTEGLHGFADAFDLKSGGNRNEQKNQKKKNRQKQDEIDLQESNFIRGNIKYRGGFKN
ncbi:unnamed protein product [Paramecium pentaurelia]|uniref:Uncharacterized protein n=1 Tax=Paramecium pentaurelia TaxID=43138 RepID=A0A8S1YEE9_9CILI|nr:unnamed protein product [Paramecium pentaurelia]